MPNTNDLSEPRPVMGHHKWLAESHLLTPRQALAFYLAASPAERATMRSAVKKKILAARLPSRRSTVPWTRREIRQIKEHLGIDSLEVPGPVR